MRAILPCAGFGTRMGMDPSKSKELLIDPSTNKPLIEYHLDICKKYELEPLIITRLEKTDLIEYCENNNIKYKLIIPEGEWMNTVLKSASNWGKYNILLLPDTKFEPINIIQNIKNDLLNGSKFSLGLHKVSDPENWCVVKNYSLIEKQAVIADYAFGIIGFTETSGLSLFYDLTFI